MIADTRQVRTLPHPRRSRAGFTKEVDVHLANLDDLERSAFWSRIGGVCIGPATPLRLHGWSFPDRVTVDDLACDWKVRMLLSCDDMRLHMLVAESDVVPAALLAELVASAAHPNVSDAAAANLASRRRLS